jgi:hypothetical protein
LKTDFQSARSHFSPNRGPQRTQNNLSSLGKNNHNQKDQLENPGENPDHGQGQQGNHPPNRAHPNNAWDYGPPKGIKPIKNTLNFDQVKLDQAVSKLNKATSGAIEMIEKIVDNEPLVAMLKTIADSSKEITQIFSNVASSIEGFIETRIQTVAPPPAVVKKSITSTLRK